MKKNNKGRAQKNRINLDFDSLSPNESSISDHQLTDRVDQLTKVFEKLVVDITKLKAENTELRNIVNQLTGQVGNMNATVQENEFHTGADKNLRAFLIEESKKEAYEAPMTGRDIEKGMQSFKGRRTQYGMANDGL